MKSGQPLEVKVNDDFLIGSVMKEDSGKAARFETKEEPEGGEVREEVCRSPAEVGLGETDQVYKRDCAKEWLGE